MDALQLRQLLAILGTTERQPLRRSREHVAPFPKERGDHPERPTTPPTAPPSRRPETDR